jgi:hypothetical protein
VDLSLAPPDRRDQLNFDVSQLRMASFPPQPTESHAPMKLLARAGDVLKSGSNYRGIWFEGASADTETCAVELSYEHKLDFATLVWHKVSDTAADVGGAFDELVRSLDDQLNGLHMAEQVGSEQALRAFAPRLTELLGMRLVLVVLADVDMLLTAEGFWKDRSWKLIIEAMYAHNGDSRLVITSTRHPPDLGNQMQVEAVTAIPGIDPRREALGTGGR